MKRVRVAKPIAVDKRRTRSQCRAAPAIKEKSPRRRKSKSFSQDDTTAIPSQNAQRIVGDDDTDFEIARQSENDADLTLKSDTSDEYNDGNETVMYKQASCSHTSPYFDKNGAKRSAKNDEIDLNLDSSEDEWEEVENEEEEEEKQVVIPKEGVEITIDPGDLIKRRKQKKFDWNNYARLCVNRFRKDLQQDMHKVHVMCLLGHGLFVNSEINSDFIKGLVMSIIPDRFFKLKPKKMSLRQLHDFVSWFHDEFRVDVTRDKREIDFRTCLIDQVSCRTLNRSLDCAAIFISALRLLGFDARLVLSMQPTSAKAIDLIKPKPVGKNQEKTKIKSGASLKDCTKKIAKKSVDSDFELPNPKRKTPARKRLRTITDADGESKLRKKAKLEEEEDENETDNDYWAEVYLEKSSQWVSIDTLYGRVECDSEIEDRTKRPFIYVVSFDNGNKIKDLTSRYAKNWLTLNRKLRCDPDWWVELLEPFGPRLTAREKKENAAMEQQLTTKPLPTTIGEFKGHPLYALARHLLKFEAFYPPDPAPVGFIRGEPIYSRDCVHQLHSRETWLKEAKSIIIGEKPYKIVKARPKWNKNRGQVESNLPLEVFGAWQTQDYEPPIATNGKVPRNEYGNVDMFKECMLPVGTVHLRAPRLLKVARKLGIDCAAAMTGWDFLKSGNRPIFDGWIVCEEFEEVLMAAWRQQMKVDADRQGEKREKRVYGNWRRLIRAVFIREKLNTKYFKLSDK